MNKNSKLWIVLKGLIAENPVLVLVLGTCPVLAVSTSIVSAISMGIAATLVLICSNTLISLLRKIIPDTSPLSARSFPTLSGSPATSLSSRHS